MSTDAPAALWDAPETAEFWPSQVDRILLDETDSTMAEARRRAPTVAGPTWILARHQRASHGRRGRPWSMPSGNFAATLLFRPDCDPATAALRSFLAAIALRQTLAMTASPKALSLKWPNDVLLNGGKVAGILLESSGSGGRVDWLAIGIGVNLVAAPGADEVEPEATPPVSLFGETGTRVAAEDFLFWLASHFDHLEQLFQRFGFDPIRRLWLRNAARLGQPVRARTSTTEHHGTFETLDGDGNLVLSTAKGRIAVPAADIYF